MAIINTLQKCLESPYLFEDKDAPARVDGLLGMANERIEIAKALNTSGQAEKADVSFFCYEAMFYCLRALVYTRGYREAGLRCLLLACGHLYVGPGLLDVAHLHAFERVQGLKSSPEESLVAALAFVARTSELLGRPSATPSHPPEA